MAVDFTNKRFRSDFDSERKRFLAAIKDCETLDKDLTETKAQLQQNMARTRGAASLVVRITEQIISNRNQRVTLIKELKSLRKDIVDREIRLAVNEQDQIAADTTTGVTAALLAHLQSLPLIRGGVSSILDPIDASHIHSHPPAAESPVNMLDPVESEDEFNLAPGDIVSDMTGKIWVITDDGGAEETSTQAAEIFDTYAVLEDGRQVVLVDIA